MLFLSGVILFYVFSMKKIGADTDFANARNLNVFCLKRILLEIEWVGAKRTAHLS